MSSRFITEDDLKKILESLQVGEPIDFISLYASNTLSLTSTFQTLPYNAIRSQASNGGFTHNGQGGIICNKNGYIEISACYYYTGTQGELYYLYPHKNDVIMSGVAERCASTTDYVSLPAFIISVASGDIITFKGKSASGKAGIFANGGMPLSNATLKYISGSTYNINTIYPLDIDKIYPVGSIYMSVNNVNPETFMSGTVWEQIQDRFLLAAGLTYAGGSTGGAATVTLDTTQIPAHTHGSESLTGYFQVRRYGSSANTGNYITTASGIASLSYPTGQGGAYGITGNTTTSTTLQRLNINATHEHNSVGGSKAHNNMPPYLTVYMWKRTA